MTSPRDGATIMLVRDGAHRDRPLEVLMVRRHPRTAFGSIHAFPGGVVDAADSHPDVAAACDGRTDLDASAELGIPAGGLAFWIAAIRESFEEVGLLLARDAGGQVVRFSHADHARFTRHRGEVATRATSLLDVLLGEGLRLATDSVHYVAHWITPVGAPKRFDTRFFLARAPDGQAWSHDEAELIGSEWIRPADALARCRQGSFPMIEPTIASLEDLRAHATADEALAARGRAPGASREPA